MAMETLALDAELSDELRAMRDAVRKFVAGELEPWAKEIDRTGDFPPGLIEVMQKNGYCGMRLPVEYGGGGLEPVSVLHRARGIQPAASRVHHCRQLFERHDADGDHASRHAASRRKNICADLLPANSSPHSR